MAYQGYETLLVFQKSYALAMELHKLSQAFPKHEQYGGIADQIRRSSKSICANIAEGISRKTSESEEKRYLSISLGSCEETRVWLLFCRDLTYLMPEQADELRVRYSEVAKMLFGMMRQRS